MQITFKLFFKFKKFLSEKRFQMQQKPSLSFPFLIIGNPIPKVLLIIPMYVYVL